MDGDMKRSDNFAGTPNPDEYFMTLPDGYLWCPLKWKAASDLCVIGCALCDGPSCAWWDTKREKCGVLPHT